MIFVLCIIFFLNINIIFNFNAWYTYGNTNEKYVIQVGVFENQFNASQVYNLLIKNKFPAYMRQQDKIWVYVGQYDNKAEADRVLKKIQQIGLEGYVKKVYGNTKQSIGDKINSDYPKEIKSNEQRKSKNYHLNNDVTINGIFGNYSFFININKHWRIENAYFELIFSQSQIKNYKNSAITVEINNIPIYSTLLYDKAVNKERIKISIPLDKINDGFNEIKIKCYHRITDEPCADIINPGNWIVFHKESYIHIEYNEKQDTLSLMDYPYPYLNESNNNPINHMIIVPDKYQSYILNAAVILAANFGQRHPYVKFDINISKFSDAADKNKKNIIYIGNKDNTPKEILSLISDEELNLISSKALIKEVNSPYNSNYKMLLILSNDVASMLKAVKVLSNNKLISQMDKSYQWISGTMDISTEEASESEYLTLENLGYSNMKLEGIFYQRSSFGINIPKDWKIREGALLHIDMRYSEVLNFDRSLLTVYLNDVPIGSKKLYRDNAHNDIWEIQIPKELKDSNYYNLEIVFYFELDSQECNYRRDSNSWAYISNKSYFYLPHDKRTDSYFENYESPFIKNKEFNNVLLIVPENLSSQEMSIIKSIVAALGRNVNSLENIEIKTPKEAENKLKNKNLIIIGTPNRNPLLKEINDRLHIKFSKDFSKFLSNEKITLLEDYNQNLSSLQLIQSPFDESKTALIVTAIKDEGLNWVKEFLTEFNLVNRLKGNAVVIDKYANIQAVYYGISNQNQQNENINSKNDIINERQDIKKLITNKQMRNYIIFIISVLSFIIISSIVIMRKNRKY